jgi:DNA-3-methyladenine glycosylase
MRKLPREFYARDPIIVARELLGKFLVHNSGGIERIGRIVEVEAYLGPHDLAAHSSKGMTPRTQALFGPPGHAYVYLIYGMHHCFNTVTGNGSGILLRALEPVKNIEGKTQGPGLLCRAMGIDKRHYGYDLTSSGYDLTSSGHDLTSPGYALDSPDRDRSGSDYDLTSPELYIGELPDAPQPAIVSRPRIGVAYARHWARRKLRFYIRGNTFVSKP